MYFDLDFAVYFGCFSHNTE